MFIFNKAKLNEVTEIKNLLKDSWLDTYGSYYTPESIEEITSLWHDKTLLTSQIQNPGCYFATAKNKEGKIVGIITARRIENDQSIQLDRLYILPDYQRKGIGKTLLINAIDTFKGISRVYLDVEVMNKKAIEFYKKQGFKDFNLYTETIKDYSFKVLKMMKKLQ